MFPDDDDYCPDRSFRRKNAQKKSKIDSFMHKMEEWSDSYNIHQVKMFRNEKKCSKCDLVSDENQHWFKSQIGSSDNYEFFCSLNCLPSRSTTDKTIRELPKTVPYEFQHNELDDIF